MRRIVSAIVCERPAFPRTGRPYTDHSASRGVALRADQYVSAPRSRHGHRRPTDHIAVIASGRTTCRRASSPRDAGRCRRLAKQFEQRRVKTCETLALESKRPWNSNTHGAHFAYRNQYAEREDEGVRMTEYVKKTKRQARLSVAAQTQQTGTGLLAFCNKKS